MSVDLTRRFFKCFSVEAKVIFDKKDPMNLKKAYLQVFLNHQLAYETAKGALAFNPITRYRRTGFLRYEPYKGEELNFKFSEKTRRCPQYDKIYNWAFKHKSREEIMKQVWRAIKSAEDKYSDLAESSIVEEPIPTTKTPVEFIGKPTSVCNYLRVVK